MKTLIIFFLFIIQMMAQVPGPAYNPMTAPGAIGISLTGHTLIWVNPENVDYNEVYFSEDSLLVANLDTTARIFNGYPSIVRTSIDSTALGNFVYNTRYFWRVVEYNSSGITPSPVWYFISVSPAVFLYENHFDSDLEGWKIAGPLGYSNWHWQNSGNAGGLPGEVVFSWDPIFIGDSYLISPEFPAAAGTYMIMSFNFYEDWWSDTVTVGCAYTTDDGYTWASLWELTASGNVGPTTANFDFTAPENFRLGFYYTGNSNNIDFLYVDDLFIGSVITPFYPPYFLQAQSSETEQKVNVQWNSGWGPGMITGYELQRKNGLPTDTSSYSTITVTNGSTFSFEDPDVELNQIYTYRVCTLSSGSTRSSYGNEATAYIPAVVPVELVSFSGSYSDNEVLLKWSTASEINNRGFEIQRLQDYKIKKIQDWETIGFVNGNGTTTELHNYSFTDNDLKAGTYKYRLKQIDFDGSYEYSNIIEVEVNLPDKFILEQNYPNPFNPTAKIKYQIPYVISTEGRNLLVSLKVYDILGNEAVTLVNEEKPAGSYEVEFDGTRLPSGVYFYQLKVNGFVETKKMILMK